MIDVRVGSYFAEDDFAALKVLLLSQPEPHFQESCT
jgi:hypothetical protein